MSQSVQISHLPPTLHLTVCFQGWICQQPHWPHWTWHVACYGGLQPYLQGSSLPVNPAIYHCVITLLAKHSIPASSLLETQKRPSGKPLQCGLVPRLNAVYVAAQIPPAEDRNTEWEADHDCKLLLSVGVMTLLQYRVSSLLTSCSPRKDLAFPDLLNT